MQCPEGGWKESLRRTRGNFRSGQKHDSEVKISSEGTRLQPFGVRSFILRWATPSYPPRLASSLLTARMNRSGRTLNEECSQLFREGWSLRADSFGPVR